MTCDMGGFSLFHRDNIPAEESTDGTGETIRFASGI
jgi:hypothetical protein